LHGKHVDSQVVTVCARDCCKNRMTVSPRFVVVALLAQLKRIHVNHVDFKNHPDRYTSGT